MNTNLYLGYGAQSTTLQVTAPSSGAPYTYSWSGNGSAMLSSTTIGNPVFTPTIAGNYTFTVVATNKIGCSGTATITICVTDIRVTTSVGNPGDDDDDDQWMCDHNEHDSTDCPHKGHGHNCDHKSHSKYNCSHKHTNDKDDDDQKDCDHKAHDAKDCGHKGHNHKYCDHKSHQSKYCDHDKSNSNGDQKVCDHKSHSNNDCSHEGHNHKDCDHKAHESKDCPHSNKYGNSGNYKVYVCHVPPGNPGKTITLHISINAVEAHLTNHSGDRLGRCDQQPCTAIVDTEKPVISCPANVTVSCGGSTLPGVTGSATATDNSGVVSITYSDVTNGNVITRTWKATDPSGNFSTCVQTITISAALPVTISSVPTDNTFTGGSTTNLYLGYGAQSTTLVVNLPSTGAPFTFAWSGTGVSMLSSTSSGSPVFTPTMAGNYTFTVVVTNKFGCSVSASISICVTDIRVNTVAKGPNEDDDDDQWMCDHSAHDASDCTHKGHNHSCDHKAHTKYNCGHRNTNDKDDEDEKNCDHKAHDSKDCTHKGHNHKTCDHKSHQSKYCDHDKSNSNGDQKVCDHKSHDYKDCSHEGHNHKDCDHKSHEAKDCPHNNKYGNSGNYKVYVCHVPPGNPGKTITLHISINAVAAHLTNHPGDRLGTCDMQPCSGVVDNVKPVIECPANITVSCGTSTSPAVTGSAVATDNTSYVCITYSDVNGAGFITRTWKATDASGNFSTCTQTITITDNVKPIFTSVPGNVTISCGTSTAPTACGGIAVATDNCSAVTITYSDVTNGNVITRTWKATDAAGNFSTAIQTITITDNVKPVFTFVPVNLTINCGASTAPSACGGMAVATDNCSAVTITYSDVTNGNIITRTWKATDASGNFSTATQTITIGAAFTTSITSVPTNSTYTGGIATNLYLGYGAQSTNLQVGSLPTGGAPYTYSWNGGSFTNWLSSTSSSSPVFTPLTNGSYLFTVTITNKFGCSYSTSITICVTDIRVPGCNGTKVYVCHTTSGKKPVSQTLEVLISQVASHITNSTCGSSSVDRLGSCDQTPCGSVTSTSTVSGTIQTMTQEGGDVKTATSEEELKVTVMPNPSTTFFTLKLESKYQTPVNMRVMDGNGRVVDAKTKISPNSTFQIGHNYSSGTYYAEMIQGTQRKVVQLIKARG